MNITEREQNGIAVFKIDGRVDSDGAVMLEQHLLKATEDGHHKMVLEMADVRYINSAGLRILAEVLTINRENNGELYLVGLSNKVKRVFQIIGFDNFFKLFDDTETALNSF